jgi:peptidoglycan-associated lipoprotein
LKENVGRKVLIEGHCDERGTREYNLGLGERRADSAARYLMDHGISGDRIRTISYGKDRPIAAQGTQEEIYRMNRVAISVVE